MNCSLRRSILLQHRVSKVARRSYAFQAAAPPIHQVFNRRTKWLQKERAAADVENSRVADYLKDEVAIRLCDRLLVLSPSTADEKGNR